MACFLKVCIHPFYWRLLFFPLVVAGFGCANTHSSYSAKGKEAKNPEPPGSSSDCRKYDGPCTEQIDLNADGKIEIIKKYEYIDNIRIIKTDKNADGKMDSRREEQRPYWDFIECSDIYFGDEKYKVDTKFQKRDGIVREIEERTFDIRGNLSGQYERQYDDNGNLTAYTCDENGDGKSEIRRTFKYTIQGNGRYHFPGLPNMNQDNDMILDIYENTTEYLFNETGGLVQMKRDDGNDGTIDAQIDVLYCKNGDIDRAEVQTTSYDNLSEDKRDRRDRQEYSYKSSCGMARGEKQTDDMTNLIIYDYIVRAKGVKATSDNIMNKGNGITADVKSAKTEIDECKNVVREERDTNRDRKIDEVRKYSYECWK